MKVNKILTDISRGEWFMDIKSIYTWGLVAHNIMYGKEVNLPNTHQEPESLIKFYDGNLRLVKTDDKNNSQIPKGSIAVVDNIGPLIKYGDWCTYGADDIVRALDMANDNPNIIGIIHNVDGPGGSASSIGPFMAFAERKKKPVVTLYDYCCSAHLWTSLAISDYMMASNEVSATIGSIGIVLSFADNKKALEEKGYVFHEIYPKESEHKNEAFRLALEGKYDKIKQEMLSPKAIQFQEFVKSKLPNLKTDVSGVLTGKTFYALDAVELGFANSIGNFDKAANMVKVLSELRNY